MLHWYGLAGLSSGAVRTACDIEVNRMHGLERPKMTEKDCYEWKLTTDIPQERVRFETFYTQGWQSTGQYAY